MDGYSETRGQGGNPVGKTATPILTTPLGKENLLSQIILGHMCMLVHTLAGAHAHMHTYIASIAIQIRTNKHDF